MTHYVTYISLKETTAEMCIFLQPPTILLTSYFSNDPLRMWPDKRVQNYIGLNAITGKVVSVESLIEKLREAACCWPYKDLIDLSS